MKFRKMQIFHFIPGIGKPALFCNIHIFLYTAYRGRTDQLSIFRKTGYTYQTVLIHLIKEIQFLRDIVCFHIYLLDHIIVHGIRNPHHITQIIIQINLHLIDQLTIIIEHHFLRRSSIALIKKSANKHHSYQRYQRKGYG